MKNRVHPPMEPSFDEKEDDAINRYLQGTRRQTLFLSLTLSLYLYLFLCVSVCKIIIISDRQTVC